MRLLEDDPSLPLVLAGLVYQSIVSQPTAADFSYPQYQVPRFVADLVRGRKLDGILYTSSKEYPFRPDVFGTNLVLVGNDVTEIVRIAEPKLFRWMESQDNFGLKEMTLDLAEE
jgi:hypothetical protein